MGDYLQHGKFKYIDKWRSKTGKWVYKYRDDVSNDVLSLKNSAEHRLAETRRYLVNKPKKEGSSGGSNWHDTGHDVILSKKEKYEESIKGNDKTRIRKVVDSSGKTSYRREYQDSAQQQDLSRKVKRYNDAIKPNSKVGRFIADFNDKYGPKYVHTISAHSGDGKNYVISYTKNLFGNRSVDVESYSYYDAKRTQRKRRRKKRRDAVKMDNMTGSLYLMHHGVKGQKWGVRKYQNSDGSLTDEGRRRYGYGSEAGTIITKNTKERMKQGTKLGAKIGAAVGGVGGATAAIATVSLMAPYYGLPAAGIMVGANFVTNLGTGTLSGGWNGFLIGSVVGAVETHKGRQYIERYDKGLDAFEKRDRKA